MRARFISQFRAQARASILIEPSSNELELNNSILIKLLKLENFKARLSSARLHPSCTHT